MARVQVSGSARFVLLATLPLATFGCAMGRGTAPADNAADAAIADTADTPLLDGATADAPDQLADALGCAIAAGMTPSLDGVADLTEYPAAQQLTLGAMLGSDGAALAWNRTHLFITVHSAAFTAAYEPLHVYVETGTTFASAVTATGKEYSGLVAVVPFAPTHLIAVRRVSDSGSGGYNGVFEPGDSWTTRTLALDVETIVSADQQTISVTVPWSALGSGGCPTAMRLALHVVHGQAANEWKDLSPSSHTPWQMPGGGYYEIDLTGPLAVSEWTLH